MIFMINSELENIKNDIRQLMGVCKRMKPLKRSVACMSKINEFKSDLMKELKKK